MDMDQVHEREVDTRAGGTEAMNADQAWASITMEERNPTNRCQNR